MRRRRALAVAAGLALVAGIARTSLRVTPGLTADYFTSLDRSGPPTFTPTFTVVDRDISTARVSSRWRDSPPDQFSVRWRGYLAVGRSAFYTFATYSDDGSWVYVDGQLVVDNGGTHAATTRMGRVWLDRGPHFVLIEYAQSGGPFAMEWLWALDESALTAVPAWVLSPRRVSYPIASAARVVEWLWWISLGGVFILAAIAVSPIERHLPSIVVARPRTAALVLFVALAILHTWPLASDPAHLSRNDNTDTVLNEWTIAWVAHQLPRAPLHLYDANIFFPERQTLAYSEALLAQAVMAAPMLWIGASPVLAYNVVLIAGFALTGWAMCVVLVRWIGDWTAGLTGGILMGFNAHTLTRLPHLQAQHVEFLPFALLALDRLLVQPRVGRALSLACWFVLQAFTSFYLLVFATVAMAAAVAVRPEDWAGRRSMKVLGCLAVAGVVAVAALLPFLLPYWHVYRDQGFTRGLDEVAGFAATWRDYLTTPGPLPRMFVARWASTNALYPGAVGVVLALVAAFRGVAFRDPRARMCLAFGVCGVALSFGPQMPGYAWLYGVFPPLHGVRAVGRFGYLGIVAVASLAAYGMVPIRSWAQRRMWTAALPLLIIVLAIVEPLAAPITYRRFDAVPQIYDRVATEPAAIVAEFPLAPPRGIFGNARYMLNATRHWKPLVNGYSGFIPASYYAHYENLRGFPDGPAIAALQAIGVTHVFAHLEALGATRRADLDRAAGLHRIAEENGVALYRVLAPAAERR